MIIIRSVEVDEVDEGVYTILHRNPCDYIPGTDLPPSTMVSEVVTCRQFVRSDGTDVMIGMSCEAADVLGLQYEAWNEMERNLESQNQKFTDLCRQVGRMGAKLYTIHQARWWTRLKWLFRGVVS